MSDLPALRLPEADLIEFGRLPDPVKEDVLLWQDTMKRVFAADRPLAAAREIADQLCRPGMSYKSIERNYYAMRRGASWRIFQNQNKLTGGGKSRHMGETVIDAWHGYCQRHQRKFKSAYRELVADYRAGRAIGNVSWKTVWKEQWQACPLPPAVPPDMPLPEGWSYDNFMRKKPRRDETVRARIGERAAYKHGYQVHTTRVGMHVGEGYVFDDMWHDLKLNFEGQTASVRPLELGCADVFSGYKHEPGFRPRRATESGKKENITERDMRLYVAHMLCNVGFYRGGCTLYVEHGTAAIRDRKDHPLRQILADCSGGKIRVQDSGIEGPRQLAQLYCGQGKGNPRLKAGYESLHNLVHNVTDHLPAQTGKDRDHLPESLYGRDAVNTKLLIAAYALTPERAALLRFPVMEWNTGIEAIRDAYYNMNRREEHDLEGWAELKLFKHQFRLGPKDGWRNHTELEGMPPEQRAVIEAFISKDEFHQVVRKSPWDVWQAGQADLIRLPEYCVPLICGPDLAIIRPCPHSEQIGFEDRQVAPQQMWFETRYVTPEGFERRLDQSVEYQWLLNPFDTAQLFVSTRDGKYLGLCRRCDVPCKTDMSRLRAEMGRAQKLELEAASGLIKRNREQIKTEIARATTNAMVLTGAPMLPTEIAAETERQERHARFTDDYRDLVADGSDPVHEQEESYAVSMDEMREL